MVVYTQSTNTIEPIRRFYESHGLDISRLESMVSGARYSAILLKNGNIGVCANLGIHIDYTELDLAQPKLDDLRYRILLNAYYNALLNYHHQYDETSDIFDKVDFSRYKKIGMIGLFRPLLKKFQEKEIPLTVFDRIKNDPALSAISDQSKFFPMADALIVSSTTMFNQSFSRIMANVSTDCDVFLLGPSSIMDPYLFVWSNIKIIFGSVFEKFDRRVLDIIQKGGGTRQFQKLGKKVYLENTSKK